MRTIDAAIQLVADALAGVVPADEHVAHDAALGRVVVDDVVIDHDLPPFRRAMMDGYACASADVEADVTLPVAGVVHAGDPLPGPLPSGHAMRIMTGAPVPPGAERVVPYEWTDRGPNQVRIERVPSDAVHIAEQGSIAQHGSVIVNAPARISASVVAALATCGVATPRVARKVRIAILATGSELVDVADALRPGTIRNSNAAMLAALARQAGADVTVLEPVADDEAALDAAIQQGLSAHLLLLTGGVSAGDKDLVPDAMARCGIDCLFHRWAVQPGGPLWCGLGHRTLAVGLPGNPAAVFVGFELFVRPLIDGLEGLGFRPRATVSLPYEGPWGTKLARARIRPVRIDDRATAIAGTWRGSGDPFAFLGADALAILPTTPEPPPPVHVPCVVLGGTPRGTPTANTKAARP